MDFKLVPCVVFLLVTILCPIVFGHQGHEHHHTEESDPNPIPETNKKWSGSEIHSTQLKGFDLKWMQDPEDSKSVIMKMAARTTGYVAVGFCPRWVGTMENCDICLGWVDRSGSAHIYDYHAPGNTFPILDKKQDYKLISGSENNGVTTIEFKRLWDSGDEYDDANLEHNHVHVIFAWHPSDPIDKTDFEKHEDATRGHTTRPVAIKDHQHSRATTVINANSFTFIVSHLCAALYFWRM